jgi:hypothetical protein
MTFSPQVKRAAEVRRHALGEHPHIISGAVFLHIAELHQQRASFETAAVAVSSG